MSNLRGDLACAMLITRSGAEGISTRNVRQVHVIEPFWHANRVDQVIGRARRAHSHDDLPPAERDVEVFVYASTFTEEQAKLHRGDNGLTSDEHVHSVAQRKRKLLGSLYDVVKRAAVDCSRAGVPSLSRGSKASKASSASNASKVSKRCLAPPPGVGPGHRMYHAELAVDLRRESDRPSTKKTKAKLVVVRKDGVLYYADLGAGGKTPPKLYDYAALKERGEAVRVVPTPQEVQA